MVQSSLLLSVSSILAFKVSFIVKKLVFINLENIVVYWFYFRKIRSFTIFYFLKSTFRNFFFINILNTTKSILWRAIKRW